MCRIVGLLICELCEVSEIGQATWSKNIFSQILLLLESSGIETEYHCKQISPLLLLGDKPLEKFIHNIYSNIATFGFREVID